MHVPRIIASPRRHSFNSFLRPRAVTSKERRACPPEIRRHTWILENSTLTNCDAIVSCILLRSAKISKETKSEINFIVSDV